MSQTVLRPYQQVFIDKIVSNLTKFKQIIGCAATGSGKSKVFIHLAQRAYSNGFTVLIITEASKIYDQLTKELPAGNIDASKTDGYIDPNKVYIAMAQTLARRPMMVEQFCNITKLLIIVDEAHIGTPTKLLKKFIPSALVIGFTATPDFKFAKHLPELYQAIVVGPQPDELIIDGYLCSYKHYARVMADLSELKVKNGEFTEESQMEVFESKKVMDGLMQDLRSVPFKKCVIFTSSIKHCTDTVANLRLEGYKCIEVHSRISISKQSYDMMQFKSAASGIDICVSVGILTKGWDFPPIDLVVLHRATKSLPLYLQMIGRGSRTSDGKMLFTVLDYGGNYQRHGLWDADIDWAKRWNTLPKKKGDGVAPIKICPKCEAILPASIMICKYCGHKFTPADLPAPSADQTKLIELTEGYRSLIGKNISDLTAQQLSLYARLKNKKLYAARIAKARSQKENPAYGYETFIYDYATFMGYKRGWADYNTPSSYKIEPINFHEITLR